MSRCKACGAEIIWKKTIEGKNMCLDTKPLKKAVLFIAQPSGEERVKIIDVYTTHWETCTDADRFRTKTKGEK